MTCRPLTTGDFAAARALYAVLVGNFPVPDGADGLARFTGIVTHPGTTIWGCEADGRIVAFATLHVLPNMTYAGRPYALIENVACLPEFQRQGFGRKVMEAAIDAAWEAGCYKIMLLAGRAAGARGFYEKLGFASEDKHGMTLRKLP